jgi:6-phosphogluconolactonase
MLKPMFFVAILVILMSCNEKPETIKTQTLYIGTYTDGDSEGIYTMQFNPETGTLNEPQLKAILPNPSFLAISNDKRFLYAGQETNDFDSQGGGVSAFSITDNTLKLLNSKGTGGAHPCHVALSGDGQLAVSNYTGGNLAIFDLGTDGSLGARQLLNHNILDTTKIAHVHKAHFNEDGLFAADLGLNSLQRYSSGPNGWVPGPQATLKVVEGAGPRHFIFNTDRSFLYVINELDATITVFQKDAEGTYNPIQNESTVAEDWTGQKSCADIHLSPDGNFLYGSNRGENTLVIFSVDKNSGKISLVGRESVNGDWPRNFTLSPDGKHILVANKKSNNITVFKRNVAEGTLEYTNQHELDAPVCLVFY